MEIEKIYNHYKECNSLRKTAKQFCISRSYLTKLFNDNNYKINESTKNKHQLNKSFFDVIDSASKAYWLGFIFADGYVSNNNSLRIELKIEDEKHLCKFIKSINSDYVVKYRKDKPTCYLSINNLQLCNDLRKYGLHQNKSLTTLFPNVLLNNKYIIDFIRGYFDGDGSLYNIGSKSAGTGIIGTKEFLEGIKLVIDNHIKLTNHKIRPSKKSKPEYNVYRLETTNLTDTLRFSYLLYNNCKIYLDRKYHKYISIKEGSSTTTMG